MFFTAITITILLTGVFQPLHAVLPHRTNGMVDTRSLTSTLQDADTEKLLRDHKESPSSLIIYDYDVSAQVLEIVNHLELLRLLTWISS
jgi:hypothetical protein